MGKKLDRGIAAYIDFIKPRLGISLLVIFAVTLLSIYATSKLSIKSDLKTLLPDNYQSVKELNRMLERVGGVGSLIVVAESPDFAANKRFMDDLAVKLGNLPEGTIRYLDYKSDEVKKFYEDYFLYYLNPEDIDRLYKSIEQRIDFEKIKQTPLFVDFTDEDPLITEINDIKDRNQKNYSSPVQTVEDYYGGEWGRMLVMIIRPYGATLTVDRARRLIGTVQGLADGLDQRSYNPEMKVGFCGDVVSTVEEYDTLKKDILSTALLCITLVSLVIVVFFMRVRIVFLLAVTLIAAVSWTFALTYLLIGYLNTQTAFLGSIIVGTGINYGIIVMARYVEERKKRKKHSDAMKHALNCTFSSTFLAAATTAVSFLVLLLAKIKGLSQFGIIGSIGVMLCWAATILILPILTFYTENVKDMVKAEDRPKRTFAAFAVFVKWIVDSPSKIFITSIAFSMASVFLILNFIPNAIEYDFTKLRNKTSVSSGTEALEKRVSQLFKHSMTPAVVLLDKMDEAQMVCSAVERQNNALPQDERRVGSCYSIFSLLPKNQDIKLPKIDRLGDLLAKNEKYIDDLKPELKEKIDKIKKSLSGKVLTLADVPKDLKIHFEDLDHNQGVVVFINPRPGMLLSDGRNLIRFADTIRDIKLADGRILHAAGSSLIFSDLVKAIKDQAPVLTLAAFLAVLVFVASVAKGFRLSWVITISLSIGILLMVGLMALFKIKLNFFNFIALPLTFGIGVDYAINISLRISMDGPEHTEEGLRNTGAAVILCSLTTIIGYLTLITANNQALASFGTIAILGEITCIAAAFMLAPSLIHLLGKHKKSRTKEASMEPMEVRE